MKFKLGQRAWSAHFGWGTVYQIIEGSDYPVKFTADYAGVNVSYISDGREFKADKFPTLFHKEQKLDLGEPEIEKGTLGYFWDNGVKHIATLGKYGGRKGSRHMVLAGFFYEYDNFCIYPELPPHLTK